MTGCKGRDRYCCRGKAGPAFLFPLLATPLVPAPAARLHAARPPFTVLGDPSTASSKGGRSTFWARFRDGDAARCSPSATPVPQAHLAASVQHATCRRPCEARRCLVHPQNMSSYVVLRRRQAGWDGPCTRQQATGGGHVASGRPHVGSCCTLLAISRERPATPNCPTQRLHTLCTRATPNTACARPQEQT